MVSPTKPAPRIAVVIVNDALPGGVTLFDIALDPPLLRACQRRRAHQESDDSAFSLNCDPCNNFLANFYWQDAPIHDERSVIFFIIYRFPLKASA